MDTADEGQRDNPGAQAQEHEEAPTAAPAEPTAAPAEPTVEAPEGASAESVASQEGATAEPVASREEAPVELAAEPGASSEEKAPTPPAPSAPRWSAPPPPRPVPLEAGKLLGAAALGALGLYLVCAQADSRGGLAGILGSQPTDRVELLVWSGVALLGQLLLCTLYRGRRWSVPALYAMALAPVAASSVGLLLSHAAAEAECFRALTLEVQARRARVLLEDELEGRRLAALCSAVLLFVASAGSAAREGARRLPVGKLRIFGGLLFGFVSQLAMFETLSPPPSLALLGAGGGFLLGGLLAVHSSLALGAFESERGEAQRRARWGAAGLLLWLLLVLWIVSSYPWSAARWGSSDATAGLFALVWGSALSLALLLRSEPLRRAGAGALQGSLAALLLLGVAGVLARQAQARTTGLEEALAARLESVEGPTLRVPVLQPTERLSFAEPVRPARTLTLRSNGVALLVDGYGRALPRVLGPLPEEVEELRPSGFFSGELQLAVDASVDWHTVRRRLQAEAPMLTAVRWVYREASPGGPWRGSGDAGERYRALLFDLGHMPEVFPQGFLKIIINQEELRVGETVADTRVMSLGSEAQCAQRVARFVRGRTMPVFFVQPESMNSTERILRCLAACLSGVEQPVTLRLL